MLWRFFMIAETGIFQMAQPLLDEFADFVGVVDAAKPGGMEVVVQVSCMAHLAPAASSIDAQIGHAEETLNGALRDGDVLDVCEGDGHFLDGKDAFAHAEAAIGDDVPALFVIEAENGQNEQALEQSEEEDQERNNH